MSTILNLSAMSLSEDALDEIQANVTINDVSIIIRRNCEDYVDENKLELKYFPYRRNRCDGRTDGCICMLH